MKPLRVIFPTFLVVAVVLCIAFRKPILRSVNLSYGKDVSHSNLSSDLNQAKAVMLACQNFVDTQKIFPFSEMAKSKFHPEISWRLAVFPYADQNSLYDQYSVDEAWNSERNHWIIEEYDHLFKLFNGNLFSAIESKVNKWADLKDGSEQTIAIIENPKLSSRNWTQSNDLTIDEAVDLVLKIKEGDSLIAANYAGDALRIRSPKLTRVTKSQIRSAFVGNDGTNFKLKQLE